MKYTLHTNEWNWGTSIYVISEKAISVARITISNTEYENECWIVGVSVLPEYRRRGYATNLLKCCEDICKQYGISKIHLESCAYCRSLYDKLGYQYVRNTGIGLLEMCKEI